MCGIFAYLGDKSDAGRVVVKGLQKLEYRGYDSFGFAEQKTDGTFKVTKSVGKISGFKTDKNVFVKSVVALGHTRWATHGGVTKANAHPHVSSDGAVVVVHNGIVENHEPLRAELKKKGYTFKSQTDTEVICNIVAELLKKYTFVEAVRHAAARFKGRYAFVVSHAGSRQIVAARRGSPLIVGIEKFYPKTKSDVMPKVDGAAFFIASDVPAFLEYTRDVVYLDDEEMVVFEPSPLGDHFHGRFFDLATGAPKNKRVVSIQTAIEEADKGDYRHFMLKEIMEQKETIGRAINQDDKEILRVAAMIKNAYGTILLGCGTAGKVCLSAMYTFARVAKRHVNVIFGSEFDAHAPFITAKTLIIAISQSGETADVLEAYEIAKQKKAKTVGVVNVMGSSVARQSTVVLPVNAGPEKAVASTKATTAQLAILTLLAYATAGKLAEGKTVLREAASQINDMLNPRYADLIAKLAEKLKKAKNFYIIGKAENYAMALEASIKLMEVSYVHSQGFAAGELKHGPLALIEKNSALIAFVPAKSDHARDEVLSNVTEVKARGGFIVGVSPENDKLFDAWIRVPDVGAAQPIVNIIPIQLLAYHLAVLRKNNPDMPRNLAKSVTVK